MSDIVFFDKLVAEVAEELHIDKKTVALIWKSFTSSIRHLANNTDAVSILIPHLGWLFVNYRYVVSEIELMEHADKIDKKRLEAFRKKKTKLEKFFHEYPHKYLMKYRCLHLKNGRMSIKKFTNGMTMFEIEDFQNKLADEKSRKFN